MEHPTGCGAPIPAEFQLSTPTGCGAPIPVEFQGAYIYIDAFSYLLICSASTVACIANSAPPQGAEHRFR